MYRNQNLSESESSEPDEFQIHTAAPVADPSIGKHLTPDMFTQSQTAWIDIEINASPHELAQGHVSTDWKLSAHLPRNLKQIMTTKDRDKAGDEHLAGNLKRCIPLQMEICQQMNNLPFAMAIKAQGMLSKNLSQHDAYLWRVPAGMCSTANQMAFEPTNVIDRHMYNNYRICTLEDLDNDIKVYKKSGKTPGYGTIALGSLAYETLIENLHRGAWREEFQGATSEEAEAKQAKLAAIYRPAQFQHHVEVPERIASQLREYLETPIREVMDRCMNLEDFTITCHRADGNPDFASPKGLIGELVGSNVDPNSKISSAKLGIRQTFHIKAKLTYLLF